MNGCPGTRDVPDIGGRPAARTDDPCQFQTCLVRVGKAGDDESHDRNIETALAKGQQVRITNPESGRACSRPRSRKGELALRRIDTDNFNRRAARDNGLGESAVAAAYIEPPTLGRNVEPVQENFACDATPTTHQSLVGFSIRE